VKEFLKSANILQSYRQLMLHTITTNAHQPISVIIGSDLLRKYAIEWWFVFPPHLTKNVSGVPGETRKHETRAFLNLC